MKFRYHYILADKRTTMIDIDTLLAWGAVYKKLEARGNHFSGRQ